MTRLNTLTRKLLKAQALADEIAELAANTLTQPSATAKGAVEAARLYGVSTAKLFAKCIQAEAEARADNLAKAVDTVESGD